jgi:hypothetical protein
MNAIIIAIFGSCLVLVAHGIPVFPLSNDPVKNTNYNGVGSVRLDTTTPLISSYANSLSATSGMFQRVDGDPEYLYYFNAIQVTVQTTGTYTFTSDSALDTIGYIYDSSFDPSEPTVNLITDDDDGGENNYQFRIEVFLETGHTYILVVTTHAESETGSFSVSASGPGAADLVSITPTTSRPITIPTVVPAVSSSYANSLSTTSGMFQRVDGDPEYLYYFNAIQVTVQATGTYTFTSDSELDTIGYFYDNSFDPSEPTVNLITEDDDGDSHFQFRIELFLETGRTYILVVTTHAESETGSFSVSASGPSSAELISITPTTSRPITLPSVVPALSSSYANSLSTTSGMFQRVNGDPEYLYYFNAIQVTVQTTGTYTFTSDSELDTIGYFYDNSFDPSEPTVNLITEDDDGGENYYQFHIEVFLETGRAYILVVTTHAESETGSFSVSATGPSSAELISITPTTSRPITIPSAAPVIVSSFASELSSNSLVFHRPEGDAELNYYYNAIEVTVSASGNYKFTSVSELDTMGYFYDTSFEAANPTVNMITDDDDGAAGNSLQFRIEVFLEEGHTYILVVTTHKESEMGTFSVSVDGPAAATLRSVTF